MSTVRTLVALAFLGSFAQAQQTHLVAPGGSIQAAIDAAVAGDTVVVAPGTYAPFVVDKAVDVLGDGTGLVVISGYWSICVASPTAGDAITVRNVAAGESVLISDIDVDVITTYSNPLVFPCVRSSVLVEDSDGSVVLHRMRVRASTVPFHVRDSDHVMIESCVAKANWIAPVSPTQPALLVEDSTLWLSNSLVLGAERYPRGATAGGGPGVHVVDSTFYAGRSGIVAGDGYMNGSTPCGGPYGVDGSPGLFVEGASTIARVVGAGSFVSGGNGGAGSSGGLPVPCVGLGGAGIEVATDGAFLQVGIDVQVGGGNSYSGGVAQLPQLSFLGPVTQMVHTRPTLELDLGGSLTVTGTAGAVATVYASFRPGPPTIVGGVDGAVGLDLASAFPVVGLPLTTQAPGTATWQLPAPPSPLPLALVGVDLYLQAVESGARTYTSNVVVLPLLP